RDEVTFFEAVIDGHTTVYGGATVATSGDDGDDLVTITRITILPGTHLGTGGDTFDGQPLPNSLRVDGQNGSNHVEVTVWGIDDPDHHETRIEVVGTGTDPLAINTLTVNAADGDDVVLLRAVTLIPGLPARRPAVVAVASGDSTVERISYDRSVNGKLTVNGLDGDDTFVFDDTSSPSTVNGGDGDDTFLVGQFYVNPRTAPYVDEVDAFDTTPTNLGHLSNGVSRPAVLYGQAGDDRFVVSSNLAELRLEAGSGDDEFVFITSTFTDTTGATPVTAPVEQGFVSIDAGTGHSTIVIEATDPASVAVAPVLQDVLWWTVSGLGLALDLYGFTEFPAIALPQPAAQPYGLPGESDVRMLLRLAAGDITPPYVFLGRGGDGLVIITETGGWTNVSPAGPLTDSYTVRLARAAADTVYITFTTAYGAGTPFAEFSLDGGLTWLLRAVLAIAAGDTAEHTVLVRWSSNATSLAGLTPGASVVTISHTVSSTDPDFDGTDVRNVYVNLFKDAFLEPADDEPDGGLAATGTDPEPLTLLALLALLLGAAALLLARRRRIRD
ncbi:MAG TPA: LPXTG cell wall anchor domain-containing protein, partial [Protaetiibacter sp.]|nr:LPXTG cell wall anchor domain-containing protein [Protaetiibacter sp.]